MSWLDPLLAIKTQQAGTTAGTRQTINFASGATVTDDPANDRVNVAISATPADASTTVKGIVQLAGDIAGTATSVTVAKVNGVSVSGTPTSGQVIRATSGTASSWASVARGDITNTGGATGDIITGNATTLGRLAIGSTGQVLTVSGGAPVWATPSGGGGNYPADDANHTHIWRCDDVTSSTINAYKGGVNFTGGSNLSTQTGYCYKFKTSVVNVGSSITTLTAPINWNNGIGTTIELIFYLGEPGLIDISNDQLMLALGPTTPTFGQSLFYWRGTDQNCRFRFSTTGQVQYDQNRPWMGNGPVSGGNFQIPLNQAHHAMFQWGAGGGTSYMFYLDGAPLYTFTLTTSGSFVANAGLTLYIPPGMSVADIRMSNIGRDQAYARAAYRNLRTM